MTLALPVKKAVIIQAAGSMMRLIKWIGWISYRHIHDI